MAERPIILPGELIDFKRGRKLGRNVYSEEEKVFSRILGIPKVTENEIDVIPLAGKYMPSVGDRVIGIVAEVEVSGWFVDINSPYLAFMPLADAVEEFVDILREDLSRYYDINDIIFCRISKVTKNKVVQVSMKDALSRKLYGGTIVKVTPSKVARIIGKGGSMINLIKSRTRCDIQIGQNGVIWVKGENKAKAIEAILTIEKESHLFGLTEKIERLLSG
ncbi:MAG: exosome complex RNA-binding protein Rrp4 [Candidatus Aenigmatarchaeota archaeon]